MKKLELPRDEMAFRKEYEDLVLDEKLTVVFRPGNRVFPVWRGYKKGEIITARIIEMPGDDSKFITPIFNDTKKTLIIKNIEVKKLSELSDSDFAGSSSDVLNVFDLEKQILWIYKKPLLDFDNLVTRIEFEYLNDVCTLESSCNVGLKV